MDINEQTLRTIVREETRQALKEIGLHDDATWAKCYEILGEVEAGTRPLPSGYEEIAPELPVPSWPV